MAYQKHVIKQLMLCSKYLVKTAGSTSSGLLQYTHVESKEMFAVWSGIFYFISLFGIIGNALVILTILRKRSLLKSNYYYVVLHLAICDFTFLLFRLGGLVANDFGAALHVPLCSVRMTCRIIYLCGSGMMMIISVLRCRATVHPLQPVISRRNLKIACALVYTISITLLIIADLPRCFLNTSANFLLLYEKVTGSVGNFIYIFSALAMASLYYKTTLALVQQSKTIQSSCSLSAHLRHAKNRKVSFISLCTVVCYTIGNIFQMVNNSKFITNNKNSQLVEIGKIGFLLQLTLINSANPLIYGVLDRKLVLFWKNCRQKNITHEKLSVRAR